MRPACKWGKRPIKLELGVDYFVESDDDCGEGWAIMLNFSPVVPNFIYEAF